MTTKDGAWILALLIGFVASGCNGSSATTYFPLESGRTWHLVGGLDGGDAIEVAMEKTKNPNLFVLKGTSSDGPIKMEFRRTESALVIKMQAEKHSSDPDLRIPLPLTTDSKWIMEEKGQKMFADVTGTGDTTVPAGTFRNCLKLRFRFSMDGKTTEPTPAEAMGYTVWLADNVGVVRIDFFGLETLMKPLKVEPYLLERYTVPKGD